MSDPSWTDELDTWLAAHPSRSFQSRASIRAKERDPDEYWYADLWSLQKSYIAYGPTQEAAFLAALELVKQAEGGE